MSKYGLSKEQIEESRRKYGDNTLTQPPGTVNSFAQISSDILAEV